MFNRYYELIDTDSQEIIDIYISNEGITVWGVGYYKQFPLSEEEDILQRLLNVGFMVINAYSKLQRREIVE